MARKQNTTTTTTTEATEAPASRRPTSYQKWDTAKLDADDKAILAASAWQMKQDGKTYTAIAEALGTYPPMARTLALRGQKAAEVAAPARKSRKRTAA